MRTETYSLAGGEAIIIPWPDTVDASDEPELDSWFQLVIRITAQAIYNAADKQSAERSQRVSGPKPLRPAPAEFVPFTADDIPF